MAGPARYLDPAIVARLGTIDLKAKTIVEGFLTGLHRSPFKGFSVEFAEFRQYLPGDDLATLDWKIFARSDRHVVKKFEEETNLECHILLDVSRSMGYGSHAVTKIEYASYLAGALAYLMAWRGGVSPERLTTVRDVSNLIGELRIEMRAGRRAFAG